MKITFLPVFLCHSGDEGRIKISFFLQGHFFGPVAVGFGVGLVGVYKEFPVATSIVSSRSSRQYSLSTFYQVQPKFITSKIWQGQPVQYSFFTTCQVLLVLQLYKQPDIANASNVPSARYRQYSISTVSQVQTVLLRH
jgi:hypothetical protein